MNREGIVYYDNVECGIIKETDEGFEFNYFEEYLLNPSSKPVSLTLPLSNETYKSAVLFPFFDGLIPEGWLLEILLEKFDFKSQDRFGLLLKVCEDCIGAVSIKGAE